MALKIIPIGFQYPQQSSLRTALVTNDITASCSGKTFYDLISLSNLVPGPSNIQAYCHELVWAAGNMLAAAWKTTLGQPKSCTANMVMVALPHEFEEDHAKAVRQILFEKYQVLPFIPLLAHFPTHLVPFIVLHPSSNEWVFKCLPSTLD